MNRKESVFQTKLNKKRLYLISAVLGICIIGLVWLLSNIPANAAGSESIISNGGNRPYLEYSNDTTAGIERKTIVNVYLKKGETLYLGSSVYNSRMNLAGTKDTRSETGYDIVMDKPDGTALSYNVIQNGQGHINTVAKEDAGPNIDGTNTAGYTPFSYTAETDGVYALHYHSVTGTFTSVPSGMEKNPTPALFNDKWKDSPATVAAWDATIIGTDGAEKSGRMYTKCLALNIGNNGKELNSSVYVVTTDGYIYETDFNGMDPYGFIFFANNRGLVSTADNYPLYHSYRSANNELSDLEKEGITYQNPWNADTELDKTFNIFFEEPDPELEGILYPTAYMPETASNFSFIGSQGNNTTHLGYGGYFKFDVRNATSATVTIDLSHIQLGDGTVENYGKRILRNSVTAGTNYFYWDGRAEDGTLIPVGTYDNSSINVNVETYSGEYHFPLFDVERAPDGIKVTRVNKIYKEATNGSGELYNEDVSSKFEVGKSNLYYNNTKTDASGKSVDFSNWPQNIADGKDTSDAGTDSSLGAMKFSTVSGKHLGDQTALDIWTFSNNGSPITVPLTGQIIIVDDKYAMVSGRVFYDKNEDGKWILGKGDFALEGITVNLSYTYVDSGGNTQTGTATATTDASGTYRFFNIPLPADDSTTDPTRCTVTIERPMDSYTVTTESNTTNNSKTNGTEIQKIDINKLAGGAAEILFSDVGYYYDVRAKGIMVKKDWVIDKSGDSNRPVSVEILVGAYSGATLIKSYSYTLSNSNRWFVETSSLPQYADAAKTQPLTYEIIKETYTMRDGRNTYTYNRGDPNTGFPYITKFMSEETLAATVLTAQNPPLAGSIDITKRDSEATGTVLEGVAFTLWKKTSSAAIPAGEESTHLELAGSVYKKVESGVTNINGKLVFSVMDIGEYLLQETATAAGYVITNEFTPVELTDADKNISETVYNIKKKFQLDIKKADGNTSAALTGAVFTLYSDPGCTRVVDSATTAMDTTDTYAVATFTGLNKDTVYYLKETAAPANYYASSDVKEVVISADGTAVTIDGTRTGITDSVAAYVIDPVTVLNYPSIVVPATGTGVTAVGVSAFGLCLMALALVLSGKRRKNHS